MRRIATMAAAALLAGCALPPAGPQGPGPGERYRCADGSVLSATRSEASAQLAGLPAQAGEQTLLRDAGGETPQQAVYRNAQLAVTFGMGADARGVRLQRAGSAAVLDCARL